MVLAFDPVHSRLMAGYPAGNRVLLFRANELRIMQMDPVYGANHVVAGHVIGWACSTDGVYDVLYALSPTNDWAPMDGRTNLTSGGSTTMAVTNLLDGSTKQFYRLRGRLP